MTFSIGDKVRYQACDRCEHYDCVVEWHPAVKDEHGTILVGPGLIIKGDAANNHFFAWLDTVKHNCHKL